MLRLTYAFEEIASSGSVMLANLLCREDSVTSKLHGMPHHKH